MDEMTNPIEKMIHGSAPAVPDADTTRRINRALMQERIRRDAPRRRWNYRLGLMAAGLALVVLFSGQVTDVGSDGWNLSAHDKTDGLGREVFSHEREFGPGSVMSQSYSESQAREFLMTTVAGEGRVLKATGVEVHGKTDWILHTIVEIEGKETRSVRWPKNLVSEATTDHNTVATSGFQKNMVAVAKTTTARQKYVDTLDGIPMEIEIWEFQHPEFGLVRYYVGTPIR